MATAKAIKRQTKVKTYRWEGINRSGDKVKGLMDSSSIALVKADLRKKGIIPKKVSKKPNSLFNRNNKKITQADITVFSRQLATMLASGIPLIQSFDIIAKGQNNKNVEKLILSIKNNVEEGHPLAETLAKNPKFFNELFCNLVDAGEQSGCLDIMLDKIASYKEKMESIKKKIKKALFYPTAVMIVAFIVTAALLIFVVPQFESLFKGFGADLPAMTRMIIDLSEFFQSYWYIMFGGIGISVWIFIYLKTNSPKFVSFLDAMSLKIPVIGPILENAAIARFSRTLAITFAAGLPLVDALKSVSGATGNSLFSKATLRIRDEVSTGQQMQVAMKNTDRFPNMAIQMVAIGEESGNLEQMLSKVADYYEEEVDNAVDALSSLLEPLIMAILGILVGGLVIAMYLPIFKLGSVV